jgi:glycosyltransferase involved in cell wall biosynthesis
VTLVGNLLGAATRPGLYVLARDVIPRLEQRFGPDGFEVHIVGKYAPPDDLSEALNRPSVRVLGYVEDVRPEFYQADVLLVPTPIELGTRTRIIVGASFGCCTVAHAANILGIPEFRHDQDILVGSSGSELADLTLRALEDRPLQRRLGDAARATFEQHFSLRTAGAHLVEAVEQMAAQRQPR